MKKPHLLLVLLTLLVALLISVGCSTEKTNAEPAPTTVAQLSPEAITLSEASAQEEAEAKAYAVMVKDIHQNTQAHIGTTISLKGVVRTSENYSQQEFMVTRFMVDCCIDDAAPLGLLVRWADGTTPVKDAWVEVTGVISEEEATDPVSGNTFKRPILTAEKVAEIEPLASPYIFN